MGNMMLDAMETSKGKHAWTYENINVGQKLFGKT
jgi:hypothetical protein